MNKRIRKISRRWFGDSQPLVAGRDIVKSLTDPTDLAASTAGLIVTIFLCFIWLHLLVHFFPDSLGPFGLYDIWEGRPGESVYDWLSMGVPIFIWGAGNALLGVLASGNEPTSSAGPGQILFGGIYASILAGITEELRYRWIYFYLCIISVRLTNFLFFGFAGIPLGKWIHVYIGGPVFDILTLGFLSEFLMSPPIWFVGSALLVINAKFRDGHEYLGWFGWLNSWLLGFYFFWLALNHGLVSAILVHIVYDALIFAICALDAFVKGSGLK